MKHGSFCHYCNHYLGGHGLWAGGDGGSGTGLYASGNGPPPRGGSLKSIGKAFKSGNLGKLFTPSANKSTASTLIHEGIPLAAEAAGAAAGDALGGPVSGVFAGYAGHKLGEQAAKAVGDATGYGVKPRQPYLSGEGVSPWIAHVKAYAAEHGIKYGHALKEAGASYHAGKASSSSSAKGSKKNKAMSSIGDFLKGSTSTTKKKRAGTNGAWIAHVKAYATQHGVSYKQALSQAKESYHSGKKDPQSSKERFTAEIMHRMQAAPDEDADRIKADALKGDYNAAIKRNADEMMHQATNAKKRLQERLAAQKQKKALEASNSALPSPGFTGLGLRWGTEKHVQFHRNKLKSMRGELNSMENLGLAGTPSHKKLRREIGKRETLLKSAYQATQLPETQYQHKTYTPVAEDGRKKSKWIHHVKGFANYHGISYKQALSHPDSKSAYQSGDYYTMDRQRPKKTKKPKPEPLDLGVENTRSLRPNPKKNSKYF